MERIHGMSYFFSDQLMAKSHYNRVAFKAPTKIGASYMYVLYFYPESKYYIHQYEREVHGRLCNPSCWDRAAGTLVATASGPGSIPIPTWDVGPPLGLVQRAL